jgi:hypothetical protein
MPYTPLWRRPFIGATFRHNPTGRTFTCWGRLPGDALEGIQPALLTLPVLAGARDDLHAIDEHECDLVEPAPPRLPPSPKRRWVKTKGRRFGGPAGLRIWA